jgi:hypothetical protein
VRTCGSITTTLCTQAINRRGPGRPAARFSRDNP